MGKSVGKSAPNQGLCERPCRAATIRACGSEPSRPMTCAAGSSAVLAKTGGVCARCGSTRNVSAHHITGLRDAGANDPSNGVPLCSRRHAKVETARRAGR